MKKIFEYADEFIQQSDWKDLALLKICLCAIGLLWGMALPKKVHKSATFIAGGIFISTYIPLMVKFFKIMGLDKTRQIEE